MSLQSLVPFKEHYVTRAGSHAYGLATEESDLDLRGFFFPQDPRDTLGFIHGPDHWTGTGDFTAWEIRRFFHLAAKGNPNVIETLFTEEEDIVSVTPLAQKVRDDRNRFLSRRVVTAAIGFAMSERFKIEKKWDPKAASHALRLLDAVWSYLKTNSFVVRRPKDSAEFLVAVKMDHVEQRAVFELWSSTLAKVRVQESESKIIDEPDDRALNQWCSDLMMEHISNGGG